MSRNSRGKRPVEHDETESVNVAAKKAVELPLLTETPPAPPAVPLRNCGNCLHWLKLGEHRGASVGRCLSDPPSVPTAEMTVWGVLMAQPVTDASQSCSRFLARA